MKIVLGSKSPRRKEILSLVCDDFEIRVSDADESYSPDTPLAEVPKILAERKAMAIEMAEDEIIIGSDTVVLIENELLGKPKTRENAIRMLKKMSGKAHLVVSGICVRSKDKVYSEAVTSTVCMRELSDREIERYVDALHSHVFLLNLNVNSPSMTPVELLCQNYQNFPTCLML